MEVVVCMVYKVWGFHIQYNDCGNAVISLYSEATLDMPYTRNKRVYLKIVLNVGKW